MGIIPASLLGGAGEMFSRAGSTVAAKFLVSIAAGCNFLLFALRPKVAIILSIAWPATVDPMARVQGQHPPGHSFCLAMT